MYENLIIYVVLWNCFNETFMQNLKSLQNVRLHKNGKPILNLIVLFMSSAAIIISFLKFDQIASQSIDLQLAANKTPYSVLSKDAKTVEIIMWLVQIYRVWFTFCALAFAIFCSALCLNLQQEVALLGVDLGSLVQSKNIYTNGSFAEWRIKLYKLSSVVESLNLNIGPYLFFVIFLLIYFIMAILYNMLQDCQSNWILLSHYFLKVSFPLLILVLSTVAVNEEVGTQTRIIRKILSFI